MDIFFRKASKGEVITTTAITIWIFAVNIITPMITHAPTWPMFFVTIFFFILHGDPKNIKAIFLSGMMGITFMLALEKGVTALTPVMGQMPATALLLFIVLALIIVGGNYFPMFLNNITFAYLTVASIDLTIVSEFYLQWMAMLIIGGAVILIGAIVTVTLVGKILTPTAQKSTAK